jgi:signal transduction histidine kinase
MVFSLNKAKTVFYHYWRAWRNAILFTLAIAFLPFWGWAVRLAFLCPWDGIGWSLLDGRVSSVDPVGPATGLLQPGDTIVAVDGISPDRAVPLYAGLMPGAPVEFTVRRDGIELQVVVHLVEPPWYARAQWSTPLFIALAVWACGTAVFIFGSDEKQVLLFFLFCWFFSLALTCGTLSTIGPLWIANLFNLCLWWLLPFSIHFHLHFPESRPILGQRLLVIGLYGISALASFPYLVWNLTMLRASPWYSALHIASRSALAAGFAGAVVLLIRGCLQKADPSRRRQVRLVMLGGGLAFTSFTVLSLLPDVLFGRPLIPYPFIFPFLLTIPLTYGYSILRYRLIRIDKYANRVVAYVFTFMLATGLLIVLSSAIDSFLPSALQAGILAKILMVLPVVAVFDPLHRHVQSLMDWVFYGGWYKHHRVVEQVVYGLGETIDPTTLPGIVCDRLCASMKLKCGCFILADPGWIDIPSAHGGARDGCTVFDRAQMPSLVLLKDGHVCRYLGRCGGPVSAFELRRLFSHSPLSEVERQLLDCEQARLWIPVSDEKAVQGVIGVGSKLGGDSFDDADLSTLHIIAQQLGKVIRNLDLNQQLKTRVLEINGLHRQLVYLREEERKRIARELHDRIIQALIGVQYGLARSDSTSLSVLQESVRQLVGDLRNICSELRPPMLDSLGLVPAVRSYVRETARRESFRVDLHVGGNEEQELPEDVAISLFRALQEALNNVQRHAAAKHVTISLTIRQDEVTLSVCDDGQGFVVPSPLSRFLEDNSFGLVGLRERLDLIHGTLKILSASKQGTELHIRVPLMSPEQPVIEKAGQDETRISRIAGDY